MSRGVGEAGAEGGGGDGEGGGELQQREGNGEKIVSFTMLVEGISFWCWRARTSGQESSAGVCVPWAGATSYNWC